MTQGDFMSIRYFTCNCHTNPDIVCPHDNDPFNQRRMRTDWTVADFNGLSCEQVEKINESISEADVVSVFKHPSEMR